MPKKCSNSASGKYEIGYRHPPKQYQFKRGHTGNPDGINKKRSRSMASDLKVSLELELKKSIKIQKGKQTLTVTQAAAGIAELVRQFAKGDHRARRDVIVLAEKFGVDLTDRESLQGALEGALSAEDAALLADFVRRHGGQYPLDADPVLANPVKDAKLLTSPNKNAKPITASSENSLDSRIVQPEEKTS